LLSAAGWLRRKPTAENVLNPRLAAKEAVFLAPPLTPELEAAILLISPQLRGAKPEEFRDLWQKEQNGECWGEYEALEPVFTQARIEKALEVGPGMGRSAVFFSKKLGLPSLQMHLYEGDGSTTDYAKRGERSNDSLCGNLDILRLMLAYNGCEDTKIFDARQTKLAQLPGPYDLVYSFYSIGFHWSLEHFLDDLVPLMHEKSLAVFTVHRDFKGFSELRRFHCRLLDYESVRARKTHRGHNLLVMSRGELPAVGRDLWSR
jgi:hypothetical protein